MTKIDPNPKSELFSRSWPMLMFVLLAVGIGIAGYSLLKDEERVRIVETRNQLAFISKLKAAQIERWRMERLGDARVITENRLMAPAISQLLSHPDDLEMRRELIRWMLTIKSSYGYKSILLLDSHGRPCVAAPEWSRRTPDKEIEEARKSKDPVLSDLRAMESVDPAFSMDLIAPIFSDISKESLLGYLLLEIDPIDYLFPLVESWPMPNPSEKTLFVRADGDSMLVLNDMHPGEDLPNNHPASEKADEVLARRLLQNDQDFIEGIESNGRAVFAFARPIPWMEWALVTMVDKEEVLRPLRDKSMALAGVLAILTLAGGLTMGMIWNRQRARIFRRMYRAEVERQALVSHFDYLTRFANDIIILSDTDLNIVEVNERATTAYGFSREELLRMTMPRFRPPEEQHQLKERISVCESRGNTVYEAVHQRKDGSRFPVEVSLQLLETPKGRYIQGIIRDISDRKRAEDALRESEERHRSLFETMVEGVLYQGPDSRILDANPAALKILGLTLEQIKDRTCMHPFWRGIREDGSEFPGEEHPSLIALQTGDPVLNTVMGVYNSEEDDYRWIRINAVPQLRAGESSPYQVYATLQDITHEKRDELIRSARLRLLQYAADHSMEEMLLEALAEAERITDSLASFYHCLKADQSAVDLQAWSLSTTERFCSAGNGKRHSNPAEAGVWADCVRERRPVFYDDYEALAHRNGFPAGHGSISSMLSVPVMRGERVVAVLGIGNKPGAYKEWEIAAVSQLADLAWDIVERKRAEDALHESEKRFRTLFESSPIPIIEEDKSALKTALEEIRLSCGGDLAAHFKSHPEVVRHLASLINILDLNARCVELFGLRSKEDMSHFLPHYFDERSLAVFADEIVNLAGGAKRFTTEKPINTMDGKEKDALLSVSVTPGHEETWSQVFVSFVDITERKRMEEALRESEERYRTVVENVFDCVWEVDTQGRYVYISPRAREMIGYEPEELIGRTPLELMPQDEAERVRPLFRDVYSGAKSFKNLVVTFKHKNGSVVVYESSGAPITAPDGAISGYRGIDHDITERSKIEKERVHVEAQLRQAQKMEALGTLAGGIAHDFNNILSAILGYTEMALYNLPETQELLRRYLSNVLTAGNRAKELVRQILTFSRQKEKAHAPIEIDFIVKEVLKLLRATLPSTIEIKQMLALSRESAIMADPTEIHQVLMNLCANAAHAMRGTGGSLEVGLEDVAFADSDRLPDRDLKPGEYLKLYVRDTGHGMDDEVLRQIFNPFFTTKPIGQGTGMGLSVAHGIVKSCNGALTVESAPGKGSTFSLYFPKVEAGAQKVGEASQEIFTGKGRILFVDDEEALADLGQRLIEQLGYSVTSRIGSKDALHTFQSMPYGFDLLITDYTMPEMTGLDLAREVRRLRPGMPVIICSGYNEEVNEATASAHDIQGFILKPLEIPTLSKAIKALLRNNG